MSMAGTRSWECRELRIADCGLRKGKAADEWSSILLMILILICTSKRRIRSRIMSKSRREIESR